MVQVVERRWLEIDKLMDWLVAHPEDQEDLEEVVGEEELPGDDGGGGHDDGAGGGGEGGQGAVQQADQHMGPLERQAKGGN